MLDYLLNMNTSYTGITEVQRELILLITQGLNDKEIASKLGVAASTVRNHRYKLREKENYNIRGNNEEFFKGKNLFRKRYK